MSPQLNLPGKGTTDLVVLYKAIAVLLADFFRNRNELSF